MDFLVWKDELSVGLALMDADHIELVDQLNELHDAAINEGSVELTAFALEELVEYTRVHFRHEELMMRRYAYPGLESHCAQHERLLSELVGLQRQFAAAGLSALRLPALDFLTDWLTGHIQADDAPLGAFLRRYRASRTPEGSPGSSFFERGAVACAGALFGLAYELA